MKTYTKPSISRIKGPVNYIDVFTTLDRSENINAGVVNDFGEEWTKFAVHNNESVRELHKEYFDIIDDTMVNKDTYLITGAVVQSHVLRVEPPTAYYLPDAFRTETVYL